MLTFNSIDVETANADRASICQIGIVHVVDGEIVESWKSLINSESWFDPINISIHGISIEDVSDSPTLPDVWNELHSRLHGSVLVSHSPFDRTAIERSIERYELEQVQIDWLNSVEIARRAWPEKYARGGAKLKNIANDLNISFQHHDALEDARVVVEIVLNACAETGMNVDEWRLRDEQPIFDQKRKKYKSNRSYTLIKRRGNVQGPLYGQTIVFTGALKIKRQHAADLAADVGCNVSDSVTKNTTILVVGTQDAYRLRGYTKSSKHRRAEALKEQGVDIQIISEDDYAHLIGNPALN